MLRRAPRSTLPDTPFPHTTSFRSGRDRARFAAHGHVPRGVDLNATFVAMAQAHAPVTRADLRRIGSLYPPGTFDGIWAAASLVHLSDAEACDVLQQLAALLRPGGRLFTCVMSEGETGWLEEPDGDRKSTRLNSSH